MRSRKLYYPGVDDVEAEKDRIAERSKLDIEPDFVCGAPNYEKFKGFTPEQVLVWLNVD